MKTKTRRLGRLHFAGFGRLAAAAFLSVLSLVSARSAEPAKETTDQRPVLISASGSTWANIQELRTAALAGNAEACAQYAAQLESDSSDPQNLKKAIEFYQKAAASGQPRALFRMGKLSHDGKGVPQDYAAALDYYHKAATAGVAEAAYNIGSMYVSGRGVKRDYAEGVAWLIVGVDMGADPTGLEQVKEHLKGKPPLIAAGEKRAKEIKAELAGDKEDESTALAPAEQAPATAKVTAPITAPDPGKISIEAAGFPSPSLLPSAPQVPQRK